MNEWELLIKMNRGLSISAKKTKVFDIVLQVSIGRVLLLLFSLYFCCSVDAFAARKRIIFQLSNLNQWAEMKYDYFSTSSGDNYSSKSHKFEEVYHLNVDYAVLSRRLIKGNLGVDLGLNQEVDSEKGGGVNKSDKADGHSLEYDVDMQLFERKMTPVFLSASQSQHRISSPFSSPYDQETSSYSAGMRIRSRFLPVSLRYRKVELTTDGKNKNRHRESNYLSLLSTFHHQFLGEFDVSAELYDNETSTQGQLGATELERNTLEANHRYDLKFLAQRQYLASRYKRIQESGPSQVDSETWSENLNMRFGKALTGEIYSYWNKTVTPEQENLRRQLKVFMNHELYKSLKTKIRYEQKNNKYTDGENNYHSYALTLDYSKKLPRQSNFSLGYGYSYALTKQLSSNNEELIIDERITVDIIANTLSNINIIDSTISLYNSDRTILFEEGVDYDTVIGVGGNIEFLFFGSHLSGDIQLGDVVSVDYSHRVNTFVEYETNYHNYSAQLSLFNRALLIYVNVSQSDPDLIAGEADQTPLEKTKYGILGIESNLDKHDLGLRLMYLDSAYSKEESFHLFWRYSTEYRGGRMNMSLENTYRIYSSGLSDVLLQTDDEAVTNAIAFRADYKRKLNKLIQMEVDSYVYDIRGDYGDQTDVALGVKFEMMLYKLRASLEGDVSFQFDEHRTQRNESVRLNVKRNF